MNAGARSSRLGAVAAVALVCGTGLFLLDVLDLLDRSPTLASSPAGFERDLADYYAAWFAHQRSLLWAIALRESALLVAFVALALLVFAAAQRVGLARPSATTAAFLFGSGAVLHTTSDFAYLSNAGVWRQTGWSAEPPSNMIAAGRAAEAIESLANTIELASYLVLFTALIALIVTLRTCQHRARGLELFAIAQAVGLILLAVALAAETDVLYAVGGGLCGILAGPGFAVLLGRFASNRVPLSARS